MFSQIRLLSKKFGSKVYLTDELLEDRFGKPDTWTHMKPGNENEVFSTRNGEFVIKKALPFSDEEFDDEDEELDDDENTRRFRRFKLELSLTDIDQLTTTIFVSPSYSVEKRKHCDLKEYIENNDKPSMRDRLHLCLDIYIGLAEIHSSDMAHLDIKPENIFVYNRSLSIGDFGFLKRCIGSSIEARGTTAGWAPHTTLSSKRCKQEDLYSASLVVIGILSWDPNIIGTCRAFADAIKNKSTPGGVCEILREVFDDTLLNPNYMYRCFLPDKIDSDLIETLKRGIVGHECLSTRTTATKTRKVIQEVIDRLK